MGGGQLETPARGQAQPGLGNRKSKEAGTPNIPQRKAKRHNAGTPYRVTPCAGEPFRIVVSGRDRWALDQLRLAGPKGCTPITEPAPRWSAYVHKLRGLGVPIETVTEPHGGEYAGHHARYILRARVVKGGGA